LWDLPSRDSAHGRNSRQPWHYLFLPENVTAPRQVRTTGSLGEDLASSSNFCSA
jgi:hypothetical protein